MAAPKGKDAAAAPLLKVDDATKAGIAAANAAGQAAFRPVIEAAVTRLSATDAAPVAAAAPAGFTSAEAHTSALTAAERCIVAATRLSVDGAALLASLVIMGYQDALARDLAMAISARRHAISSALEAGAPHLPKLTNLRWRVDVTISSSAAPKVLRPSVIMEATLSDGSITTFEVPMEQFNELRYSVAKVLTAMGAIEGHPVLKIAAA